MIKKGVFVWNKDGWVTIALPFRLCLFINNKKQRVIYLTPSFIIQDFGKPGQGSLGFCWFNFGISFIYRYRKSDEDFKA